MKICEDTRLEEGRYQHQCPHCGRWNNYGAYGVAHDNEDMVYTGCECGKKYKVLRRGCELAKGRKRPCSSKRTCGRKTRSRK
jgi:hypothetical protein